MKTKKIHTSGDAWLSRLLHWAMFVSMGSCFFMIIITILDVFSRNLIGQAIVGVFELNEILMVCIVFLGLGIAQKERAHIRAELFVFRLSPRWYRRFEVFAYLMGFLFWTILCIQSTKKAWESFLTGEYKEGLIKFPMWPARWALALGLLILCLQLLKDIYSSLPFKKRG